VHELVAQAQAHFNRALEAQRAGDWATYGEEMKKAKESIDAAARVKR
jgi:hypothetical protein